MIVKKAGKTIYGMHLTAAERKAMDMEIRRELAEFERKHMNEMSALVLYALHEVFGFGPKRLKQFFDYFDSALEDLLKRYEMEDTDEVWLCTYKLKNECRIDIEEWEKQKKN